MRVPVRIPLLGKIAKIQYPDILTDESGQALNGETMPDSNLIRIAKQHHANDTDLFATLFHELLHLALHYSGHAEMFEAKQEEALVLALEMGMAPLLSLKPKLKGARFKEIEMPWEEAS